MRESLEVVTKNLLFTIQNKLKKPSKGKIINPSGEVSQMNLHRRKGSEPIVNAKNKIQPPWYGLRGGGGCSSASDLESDFYGYGGFGFRDKEQISAIEEQYESSTALGVATPGRQAHMKQKSRRQDSGLPQVSPTAAEAHPSMSSRVSPVN